MGEFDSVKIGVVDAWWTPSESSSEVYLGLTKGGVEFTYTPEFHDMTVDQYGKTPIDESLVGETAVAKIPLAETDLNKIKMFAHTGVWDETNKKITFGRFPGFRLGDTAGKLRLHPIAFGDDTSEDLTMYKAVNKAPLQLSYKMEDERVYQTEFNAMIKRANPNGSFLFEIGQSGTPSAGLKPDLSNLEELFALSGDDISVNPGVFPMLYGTPDVPSGHASSSSVDVSCIYNFTTYDITSMAKYTLGSSVIGASTVVDSSGNPVDIVTLEKDAEGKPTGVITAKETAVLTTYKKGSDAIEVGDVLTLPITIEFGGRSKILSVDITV